MYQDYHVAETKNSRSRLEEIYKSDIPYVSICNGKTNILFGDDLTGDINSNWYNLYYNIKTWCK